MCVCALVNHTFQPRTPRFVLFLCFFLLAYNVQGIVQAEAAERAVKSDRSYIVRSTHSSIHPYIHTYLTYLPTYLHTYMVVR
ncbi:uncharacterized protein F4812DRAFT_443993 [Daldinia caldariorum]|uniref:uncharacterized protein n=1 Tax=Daldinia caldariorum TaxID=326644 RepID=UPI0020076548|nr:uncharacterized protein F4812DRAFT_443993 [Daldinia caldariorum]KAI1464260.1 hypothetical protein F4812DRAFT_443993 [Daldinia caldariorum]